MPNVICDRYVTSLMEEQEVDTRRSIDGKDELDKYWFHASNPAVPATTLGRVCRKHDQRVSCHAMEHRQQWLHEAPFLVPNTRKYGQGRMSPTLLLAPPCFRRI